MTAIVSESDRLTTYLRVKGWTLRDGRWLGPKWTGAHTIEEAKRLQVQDDAAGLICLLEFADPFTKGVIASQIFALVLSEVQAFASDPTTKALFAETIAKPETGESLAEFAVALADLAADVKAKRAAT